MARALTLSNQKRSVNLDIFEKDEIGVPITATAEKPKVSETAATLVVAYLNGEVSCDHDYQGKSYDTKLFNLFPKPEDDKFLEIEVPMTDANGIHTCPATIFLVQVGKLPVKKKTAVGKKCTLKEDIIKVERLFIVAYSAIDDDKYGLTYYPSYFTMFPEDTENLVIGMFQPVYNKYDNPNGSPRMATEINMAIDDFDRFHTPVSDMKPDNAECFGVPRLGVKTYNDRTKSNEYVYMSPVLGDAFPEDETTFPFKKWDATMMCEAVIMSMFADKSHVDVAIEKGGIYSVDSQQHCHVVQAQYRPEMTSKDPYRMAFMDFYQVPNLEYYEGEVCMMPVSSLTSEDNFIVKWQYVPHTNKAKKEWVVQQTNEESTFKRQCVEQAIENRGRGDFESIKRAAPGSKDTSKFTGDCDKDEKRQYDAIVEIENGNGFIADAKPPKVRKTAKNVECATAGMAKAHKLFLALRITLFKMGEKSRQFKVLRDNKILNLLSHFSEGEKEVQHLESKGAGPSSLAGASAENLIDGIPVESDSDSE